MPQAAMIFGTLAGQMCQERLHAHLSLLNGASLIFQLAFSVCIHIGDAGQWVHLIEHEAIVRDVGAQLLADGRATIHKPQTPTALKIPSHYEVDVETAVFDQPSLKWGGRQLCGPRSSTLRDDDRA